jgi:hypothetical protein
VPQFYLDTDECDEFHYTDISVLKKLKHLFWYTGSIRKKKSFGKPGVSEMRGTVM